MQLGEEMTSAAELLNKFEEWSLSPFHLPTSMKRGLLCIILGTSLGAALLSLSAHATATAAHMLSAASCVLPAAYATRMHADDYVDREMSIHTPVSDAPFFGLIKKSFATCIIWVELNFDIFFA